MTSRSLNFWNTHAWPNYQDHCQRRGDIRMAMNAALSLFHMADYVFNEYRYSAASKLNGYSGDIGDYRNKYLCAACPEFNLLKDVANAHKHLWLGPNPTATVHNRSSTEAYTHADVVFVNNEAGVAVEFAPVLDSVVAMWQNQISRHNL